MILQFRIRPFCLGAENNARPQNRIQE
jgi:hypothetical protein